MAQLFSLEYELENVSAHLPNLACTRPVCYLSKNLIPLFTGVWQNTLLNVDCIGGEEKKSTILVPWIIFCRIGCLWTTTLKSCFWNLQLWEIQFKKTVDNFQKHIPMIWQHQVFVRYFVSGRPKQWPAGWPNWLADVLVSSKFLLYSTSALNFPFNRNEWSFSWSGFC